VSPLPDERQLGEAMAAALSSGQSAIHYVTQPALWPAFAAFCRRALPGSTWTETDRQMMLQDAMILRRTADLFEERSRG
jgi:hypothetical protein